MKCHDLFSGIGGFSLGFERAGIETVSFCESDPVCQSVLRNRWPDTRLHRKIEDWEDGEWAEIVCGGFPCQAFSRAARGRNNARDYWPEMARVVSKVRPRYAVAENVDFEPISRAADFFCGLGMQCDVIRIPAYDCGADHKRIRWWAIAHPHKNNEFSSALNAEAQELPSLRGSLWGSENFRAAIRLHDGLPRRLDFTRTYGNAVVPLITEMIGRAIMKVEKETK